MIDRAPLFYRFRDGLLPITNMFDVDGDETHDPAEARTLVAEMPDGRWLSAICRPGDIVRQQ